MRQALKDDPKNTAEEQRAKGPIPLTAIVLAVALVLAFGFYFLPPLLGVTAQQVAPESGAVDRN
jgi:hypothetical protein